MAFSPKLGIAAAVAAILAVLPVQLFVRPGPVLTAFGDLLGLALLLVTLLALLRNALTQQRARAFWYLMSAGCLLWLVNQGCWAWWEIINKRVPPDPYWGDVVLFVHIVPFMAAVALRPHRPLKDRKVLLDAVNFLMLLVWWVFLYMFIVFPDEYVQLNDTVYNRNYDLLYLAEGLALVFILGLVASSTQSNWRRIYWNLFVSSGLYTLGSEMSNAAFARGQYYTGGPYDLLLMISMGWMLWAALLGYHTDLEQSPDSQPASPWIDIAPRLAMVAILSLPLLGLWIVYRDHGPAQLRNFRLLVTLTATLVLGLFVFLKQILLDRQLITLLDQSRQGYENLQRLQTHLVQKEKLASLGQLVSGAAHEINNPLAAILGYSELLAVQTAAHADQSVIAEKIQQQARRTRDLVSDLLSFSQQNPSEKVLVDVCSLAQRALQIHDANLRGKNIRVETSLPSGIPRIWGNSNQLLQTFLHLSENAIDALNEVGGGILRVKVWAEENEVVIEFSDSGPGLADPQRVFDPFYTTKPVGKGTGLGLSASYGVVQDHHGHISCHNKPEGGATFLLRFPIASQAAAAVEAGKS